MPHELKSCPSTSPTHLGPAKKYKRAPEYAYRRAWPILISECDVAHHNWTLLGNIVIKSAWSVVLPVGLEPTTYGS